MNGSESGHAAIVRRWCEAVTGGDLAAVRLMVTDAVQFHGPRGVGTGADLVVDWVDRSGIHIEPLRVIERAREVVAECVATWPDAGAEAGVTRTPPTAMVLEFELEDSRISVIRRSDLPATETDSAAH